MTPITMVTARHEIRVPAEADTFDGFRDWALSSRAPEAIPITYYRGDIWVDLTDDEVHFAIRRTIRTTLHRHSRISKEGMFFVGGDLWGNREADAAGTPDGVYVSFASFESGLVERVKDRWPVIVELRGSPDMVLEVVSTGSLKKDTEVLFEAYWEAGIGEYWLVDARSDAIAFDIYKRGPKGFVATRKQAGWLKSAAFGKAFKLTRENEEQGNPEFTLHVK